MTKPPNKELKDLVLTIIEDQKALNIAIIDLSGKSDIADYVIIATGTSNRHLSSISDKVQRTLKKDKRKILGVDGEDTGDWVVMDLEDVIVHLFRDEVREYYNIEELWD
jgi:ribosome-associated protein